MTGSLVQIVDEDDPLRSDVTLLVASLLALGIPRAGNDLFHATCEAVRGEAKWRVTWSLRGLSACQRFDCVKMQAAWEDGAWLVGHATHPLAILRGGLTYPRALSYTPRYTLGELARIETPDTWLEAGIRNLIWLLREIPRAGEVARDLIRFGPRHAAMPRHSLPQRAKSRFLRYVESPSKRQEILAAK